MKTTAKEKAKKISERIETIKDMIKAHRKNIKLLNIYAKGQVRPKKGVYAPRVVKYSCIPKSEKNYRWTLQNLNTQIILLEQELATLIEYGS